MRVFVEVSLEPVPTRAFWGWFFSLCLSCSVAAATAALLHRVLLLLFAVWVEFCVHIICVCVCVVCVRPNQTAARQRETASGSGKRARALLSTHTSFFCFVFCFLLLILLILLLSLLPFSLSSSAPSFLGNNQLPRSGPCACYTVCTTCLPHEIPQR